MRDAFGHTPLDHSRRSATRTKSKPTDETLHFRLFCQALFFSLQVMTRRDFLSSACLLPFALRPLVAEEPHLDELTAFLQQTIKTSGLPALAAGAMKKGVLLGSAAAGIRKIGSPVPVTIADKFHIGSDTKAMTATVAAMFVEEGKLGWEKTLVEIFPERASTMNAGYQKVTLQMLLRHRAGTPENSHQYGSEGENMIQRRLKYLDSVVNKAPAHEPGTTFSYSNAGYIIVGAILERVSGKQWETLIRERLFTPLKMTSAGFGPSSKPNQIDQPWGHVLKDEKFVARFGDNPSPLGPAGTVHCTVTDYLRFADFHASMGARPAGLLKPESLKKLQTPEPGQTYAMGWGTGRRPWAKGRVLTHAGSNTMNYFITWVAPEIEFSIAVAVNAAGPKVAGHADEVCAKLIELYART
jgi:CubicO group peptidase (beta-lactamase class C family)